MRRGQQLLPRPGLDAARTVAETWRTRHGFGAAHGAASTRIVPVSSRLSASGCGARRLTGIERHRQTLLLISMSAQTAYAGKPCTKTVAAPREHTLKAARPAIPPTSISHEHLPGNLVNPKQQSQRLHE